VLVGSTTNSEFVQGTLHGELLSFGSAWTEPSTHFVTNLTQYDTTNWKKVTLVDLAVSQTLSFYPYYDIGRVRVVLAYFFGSSGDAATAQAQLADGHVPLSVFSSSLGGYYFQVVIPAAAGSNTGSGGGGRWV